MRLDVEREAFFILERAGFTDADAPGALAIASALLGADCVHKVHSRVLRGAEGELAVVHGRYRIYVSSAVAPMRKAYVVLHELGHWHLKQIGYVGENVEAICDGIAAALLAPRRAFADAVEEHGARWDRLASDFAISQTIAVLRYGEVMGPPVAVVDSRRTHTRGAAWPWPTSRAEFLHLAKAGGDGIRVDRLTDNARRRALLATV
jgi:hypothetical protein